MTGSGALGWGALLIVWGLAWSLLAIAVIIPHFNPLHQYPYWTDGGVLSPGGAHPSLPSVLAQLGHSYVPKLRTTLLILLPVAFLALGSPLALVALPSLALRFVSTNPAYWGSGYHYNATVMTIVFIAAIDTLARIRACRALPAAAGIASPGARPGQISRPPGSSPALMLVIAVALAGQFPLRNLWHPQTYQISAQVRGEDAAMARVPAGTTVEATLTMLAPLAARDDTYWIGNARQPGAALHRVRRTGQRLEPGAQQPARVRGAAPSGRHLPADLRERLRVRVPPGRRIGGVPASR